MKTGFSESPVLCLQTLSFSGRVLGKQFFLLSTQNEKVDFSKCKKIQTKQVRKKHIFFGFYYT
jgi:hypothetical protein